VSRYSNLLLLLYNTVFLWPGRSLFLFHSLFLSIMTYAVIVLFLYSSSVYCCIALSLFPSAFTVSLLLYLFFLCLLRCCSHSTLLLFYRLWLEVMKYDWLFLVRYIFLPIIINWIQSYQTTYILSYYWKSISNYLANSYQKVFKTSSSRPTSTTNMYTRL